MLKVLLSIPPPIILLVKKKYDMLYMKVIGFQSLFLGRQCVGLTVEMQGLGLTDELKMLEEQKRLLEQLPDMELTERAKKLRQASFKANYKMKRSLTTARP